MNNKDKSFNSMNTPNTQSIPKSPMNVNMPRDIEYNNSTIFKNFSYNKNGIGFSNFRLNDDIRKVQQNDGFIEPKIDRDNPVSSIYYQRNDNLLFIDKYDDRKLISSNNKGKKNYIDVIKTYQEVNPVMIAFFSEENINHIQSLIKAMILKSENVKISDQSEEQIVMIMRAKYMNATYLDFQPNNLKKMICTLNKDVLDEIIPIIIVSIKSHLGYIKDRSTNPYTIDRAMYVNKSGENLMRGFSDLII